MQMLFGREITGFGFAERHRWNSVTRPRLKDSFFVRLQAAFSGHKPFRSRPLINGSADNR